MFSVKPVFGPIFVNLSIDPPFIALKGLEVWLDYDVGTGNKSSSTKRVVASEWENQIEREK